MKKLALKDVKLKIYAPPERMVSCMWLSAMELADLQYSTWIGGSILAGLSTFKKVSRGASFDVKTDVLDVGIGR